MASVFRVRTVFTGVTGSPWVSTAYLSALGSGTAQQAATAVGTFWGTIDNSMDSAVNWTTLADVETFDPADGHVTAVTSTTPVTGVGSGGASGLPIATQMLIKWRTGVYVGGREIRGRWFIPGLSTAVNNDGVPQAATVTTFNTAAAALITDPNSELLVWSRAHGQVQIATSGSTWSQFAVLRSRRD